MLRRSFILGTLAGLLSPLAKCFGGKVVDKMLLRIIERHTDFVSGPFVVVSKGGFDLSVLNDVKDYHGVDAADEVASIVGQEFEYGQN